MTKLELTAIGIIVIAGIGLAVSYTPSSADVTKDSQQSSAIAKQKQPITKAPAPRQAEHDNHSYTVDRRSLPVAHGYADKDGKQINPETGERLRPPPPPPAPSPNVRRSTAPQVNAHSHGHEHSHTAKTDDRNTPPPPAGANKG